MTELEQIDFLTNDAKVLHATSRRGAHLVIDGDYMPDGEECSLLVGDGQLNASQASAWCTHVRSEWNARKDRQNAATNGPRPDHNPDGAGGGVGAGGRHHARDEHPVQGVEGGVEAIIEAQVARADSRLARLREERESVQRKLAELDSDVKQVTSELAKLRFVLEALKGEDLDRSDD